MSPHTNDHTHTKEGYLIAIEEELNLLKNLPKSFYRLDIETAREIYNSTLVSGKIGFIEKCNEINISIEGVFDESN